MAVVIPFPQRAGFEPWVSKKQLSRHLGCSTRWIELRHHDGLPSQLVGGRRKYRISEVEGWIKERYR